MPDRLPTMTGMTDNPPPIPGQLSVDGPPGDLAARAASLRGQLEALDFAKAEARAEALDNVAGAAKLDRMAGAALTAAVHEARGYGATWQQIADAVGITRQTAHARWAATS